MTMTDLSTGHDADGNSMTADADTIRLYDRAIDQLLRYELELVDTATALTTSVVERGEQPAPMSLALGAYLTLTSTDPADLPVAAFAHALLVDSPMNERERLHSQAVGAWIEGSWTGAGRILDEILVRWPTDLLALVIGHQLDFFVGDAQSLRDRPLRTLREMDPDHPHAAFVRGMTAFGLEESGHYAQALDAGLAAVAAHPEDIWAIHAVAHTYEMQGLVGEGIDFMRHGGGRWESGSLFTMHNWWHLALFLLEAGRIDEVIDIFDTRVRFDGANDVPLELVDASALLWRLHLDGVDTGARFADVAQAWQPVATAPPWYTFNDLHATMAMVGAGRRAEAVAVVDRMATWLTTTGSGTNAEMTGRVGLPACRAVIAHHDRRYDDVIAELYPIRRQLQIMGGSNAQRDVLQRTLVEAALGAGRNDLALALTSERLGVRESGVYGWTRRARALRGLGDPAGAAAADEAAAHHRDRFSAAG